MDSERASDLVDRGIEPGQGFVLFWGGLILTVLILIYLIGTELYLGESGLVYTRELERQQLSLSSEVEGLAKNTQRLAAELRGFEVSKDIREEVLRETLGVIQDDEILISVPNSTTTELEQK